MGVKFSNNGHSTLAASITTSATSITVASGHGARFPSLSSGEYFYATLIDSSNNLEIVKCTARSSDVLTVTRAQESTTARAFAIGDRIELRVTAQGLADATNIDDIVPSQSGNSGKFLTTDGTNVSFGTVTQTFGLQSQQVFTSNGTWTKPTGINKVKVYVTGGGGGGAGGGGANNGGGGGGAGGTAIEIIDVSSVTSVAVTIGGAGGGGAQDSDGGNGGTSSFGSYCSATGGGKGIPWNSSSSTRSGDSGVGSGGDINLSGGQGSQGVAHDAQDDGHATDGGASFWGGGGHGAVGSSGYNRSNQTYSTAQPGQAYGSGGGGGGHTGGNQAPGAAGKAGIVVVEEYA